MGKDQDKIFGDTFEKILRNHGLKQVEVASSLDVSRTYVSSLVNNRKRMAPERIDEASKKLGFDESETRALHRAAARDAGFKIDLPDDF